MYRTLIVPQKFQTATTTVSVAKEIVRSTDFSIANAASSLSASYSQRFTNGIYLSYQRLGAARYLNSARQSSSKKLRTTKVRRLQKSSAQCKFSAQSRSKSTINTSIHNSSSTTTKSAGEGSFNIFESLRLKLREILLRPRTLPLPRWITPRHISLTFSECCGHASFILVATSYAVNDFLMLRIIAVAGSTSMLFFTYFHPHGRVLWLPFKWNLLFIAINSYRIFKALHEEYAAKLISDELLELREEHLSVVKLADFGKLIQIGELETFQVGDVVVHQSDETEHVRLIIDGKLDCYRDGTITYHLDRGDFVSEAGLHAGLELVGPVESCVQVHAVEETRCIRWDRTELTKLLKKEPILCQALQSVISWDIVRKLKGQRLFLIKHEIDDPELWTIKRNEQNDHRYRAILKNILSHHGHLEGHRKELNNYRLIHQIDDEYHEQALEKCGWTPEEFELGHKKVIIQEGITKRQVIREQTLFE